VLKADKRESPLPNCCLKAPLGLRLALADFQLRLRTRAWSASLVSSAGHPSPRRAFPPL